MSQTIPLSPEFMRGLQEAEATYRHLVEGIPAVLYIDAVDEFSTNLYTSPQVEAVLGFATEEWRRDPGLWLAQLHEDDRERVVAEHRRSNQIGEPFRIEYRMVAADGREVWVRDEAVLVRNADGKPQFWRGVMFDITEQKQAEEKLRRSLDMLRRTTEERRELLLRLEQAQEEERRRIAADIHDDSIQVISAADLQVQALLRDAEGRLRDGLAELHQTLALAVDRLRHLLFELRPPALDHEGIAAALRTYVADAGEGPAVRVRDDLEAEPPPELRAVLFRIAQEAIVNARKHSGASRVDVSLGTESGGVRLSVADDGRGFDPLEMASPVPGHIGLPTIAERAEVAGGWCRVNSAPREGTTVEVWLPVPAMPADAGLSA